MNQRIKELAKQAKSFIVEPEHASVGGVPEVSFDKYSDLEKFAELIVEECIDVVLRSDPSPKMIAHEPYRTIMNNIVEHFGVEE